MPTATSIRVPTGPRSTTGSCTGRSRERPSSRSSEPATSDSDDQLAFGRSILGTHALPNAMVHGTGHRDRRSRHRRSDIVVLMSMRSAMLMTATGVALGIATGTYLTRFIASQLYAVDRLDPATFGGAAIVMLASAAAAAYWPARRAVVDDPAKALRCQ